MSTPEVTPKLLITQFFVRLWPAFLVYLFLVFISRWVTSPILYWAEVALLIWVLLPIYGLVYMIIGGGMDEYKTEAYVSEGVAEDYKVGQRKRAAARAEAERQQQRATPQPPPRPEGGETLVEAFKRIKAEAAAQEGSKQANS